MSSNLFHPRPLRCVRCKSHVHPLPVRPSPICQRCSDGDIEQAVQHGIRRLESLLAFHAWLADREGS